MDKTDLKILLELDKNPRISLSQLARSVRISKEKAQYRFKQLVKKNILTGFYAFVNLAKLGYQTHKILIKYKSVTNEVQEEIKEYILDHNVVAWAGYCEGTWDLVITTVTPTSRDLMDFYTSFFNKFGRYFKQKEILIPIDDHILNEKYLSDGCFISKKRLDFHTDKTAVDETDRKIITEISINSRATFTEIGEKLGVNYWTIAQRYKKLASQDLIMALKPRIDFRKLGLSYYHLLIELNHEEIKDKIISYYVQHKSCIMIMNHAGHYSLHLEFVLRKDEMNEVIIDLRERFGEGIMSYEPLLIIEEYIMNLLR